MENTIKKIEVYKADTSYFYVNQIFLDYESNEDDKKLIDLLLRKTENLSQKVNQHAANNSKYERSMEVVKANIFAGLLAEYVWSYFINNCEEKKLVYQPVVTDLSNQIDIASIDDQYTFEVRSSFPRKGVDFAVKSFRIIGPYTNNYKSKENQRNFYLTALFPLGSSIEILNDIKKDSFTFSLTGGATMEMMFGEKSFEETLKPDDALFSVKTEYRLLNIIDGLDYNEMLKKIKETLDQKGQCN